MFHKHYFKNFPAEKLGVPQGPLREDRGTLQEGGQSSSTANICLCVNGCLQNKAASYITVRGKQCENLLRRTKDEWTMTEMQEKHSSREPQFMPLWKGEQLQVQGINQKLHYAHIRILQNP